MKVAEGIESYLSAQRLRGLEPSSVRTTGHALRTVLEPVLDPEIDDLGTAGVGEQQRAALGQRLSRTSGKPLTPTTRELYINAASAFLGWCIGQGWLKTNALMPARTPPPAPHLGTLIRKLRLAAGLASWTFGEQVGVNAVTIKALELGRFLPKADLLRRLLTHSAMARLPQLIKDAGLELATEAESNPGSGAEPGAGAGGEGDA